MPLQRASLHDAFHRRHDRLGGRRAHRERREEQAPRGRHWHPGKQERVLREYDVLSRIGSAGGGDPEGRRYELLGYPEPGGRRWEGKLLVAT